MIIHIYRVVHSRSKDCASLKLVQRSQWLYSIKKKKKAKQVTSTNPLSNSCSDWLFLNPHREEMNLGSLTNKRIQL